MSLFDGSELREIYLSVPSSRMKWEGLLAATGLTPEKSLPDYTVGIFDMEENLIGTASLDRDIVKYVAIDPSHQGEAIANRLISAIISQASHDGVSDLTIFTKPEYATLFSTLSFNIIGRSKTSVMLESNPKSLKEYKEYLANESHRLVKSGERVGAIVMNANPPTKGHLHLIRHAASAVDHLFVIPLADNPSTEFSYQSRRTALLKMTESLRNVKVLEGSRYCISSMTFPSYFIKEIGERTDSHILLDLDIFARHIATSLGVSVRFVGQEPVDKLTARYNGLMKSILPEQGIDVIEIPRLSDDNENPISASDVRRSLKDGNMRDALKSLPFESVPSCLARLAVQALRRELDLTPKPGLVDRDNSGSHSDMDYQLMNRSIDALESVFEELAFASMTESLPDASILKPIGIKGEMKMKKVTGGVNTHSGALFSLGLCVSASAWLIYNEIYNPSEELQPKMLKTAIIDIASSFPDPVGTHGAEIAERYGIPTAINIARSGYNDAFEEWRHIPDPLRRLLSIMRTLEDSNVYYRGKAEGAEFIRKRSSEIAETPDDRLLDEMRKFDRESIERNLSPGGAADMLALTFFLESVLGPSKIADGIVPVTEQTIR